MATTAPARSAPDDSGSTEAGVLRERLAERDRQLAQARAEARATADVLAAIGRSSGDPQAVLDAIAEHAARLCGAEDATITRVDGDRLMKVANYGTMPGAPIGGGRRTHQRGLEAGALTDRAVAARRTLQLADVAADPELGRWGRSALEQGTRAAVATPLLRGETPIGVILIRRRQTGEFSPEQITLLETFAAQAVIAIENARLFAELEEGNATLQAALEQQTATAEVLRVIASSPSNLPDVLHTILAAAGRLCDADRGHIQQLDPASPDTMRPLAFLNVPDQRGAGDAQPLTPTAVSGAAILQRRTIHVPDLEAEEASGFTFSRERNRSGIGADPVLRTRTLLAAPLLRDGVAIGAINLRRVGVRPFTDDQVRLLESFAAQAVIAIQNARLFQELQESNATLTEKTRQLTESLEQQTATADILRVIASSPNDLPAVLEAIAKRASQLVRTHSANILTREGERLRVRARAIDGSAAPFPPRAELVEGVPLTRARPAARAVIERRVVHVPDIAAEADAYPDGLRNARLNGWRCMLAVPLLRAGEALGAIALARAEPEPFADQEIALVQSFADQAVIAIENARLFTELQARLAEQTATSDVLRVIASSPTDIQSVLDTIAETAARLCQARTLGLYRLEAAGLVLAGRYVPPEYSSPLAPGMVIPAEPTSISGRAIGECRTINVPNLDDVEGEYPVSHEISRRTGHRAQVSTPLLHQGKAVGVLSALRMEPVAFTEEQVRLLETFASQAVIAIENARLFSELNESNATLKEALEQQTATAEVLRVIAAAPNDLQRVLDAVTATAARLCGAERAAVMRLDGDAFVHAGGFGLTDEQRAALRAYPISVHDTATVAGRAAAERRPVQIEDVLADPGYGYPGSGSVGYRSIVAVPLLRHETLIGVFSLARLRVAPFTPEQIALVQSFADQAVIAIENARLFQELQGSNAALTEQKQQLTEALEQQTATSDILRVIARSPDDLEAVLRAVCEAAARLTHADEGFVSRADGDREGDTYRIDFGWDTARGATFRSATAPGNQYVARLTRDRPQGRAVLERRPSQVEDMLAPPEWLSEEAARGPIKRGVRTYLAVPMLHERRTLGTISVTRKRVAPFSPEEIALVETFASQAAIAIENTRLFTELRERDERRRLELERASVIQQRLLPERVEGWPGALEVAVRFRPAVETSGDFYDVLPLPAGQKGQLEPLQIAVGDVAGKGMSAALVTALARSALQLSATVPTGMATPAATLRVAGQRLHRDVGSGHFVACALAVVEPPGRHNRGPLLRLANAAQVPVLLVRSGRASEIEPPGYRLPLGAEDDGAYEDAKAELRPGDVVVFSSDGLVEAPALPNAAAPPHLAPPEKAGELFGFARVAASATHWSSHAASAEEVAQGIWSDLTAWCGEESHHDDVTLLVLRVPASRAAGDGR